MAYNDDEDYQNYYDDDEESKRQSGLLGLGNLPITPITGDYGQSIGTGIPKKATPDLPKPAPAPVSRDGIRNLPDVSSLNVPQGTTPSKFSLDTGLGDLKSDNQLPANVGVGGQDLKTQAITPVKKQSFLEKILGINESQQPQQVDQYGIPIPQPHHISPLMKLLGVALPTIYGISRGVGPLPGILTSLAGMAQGKTATDLRNQKIYENERGLRQKQAIAGATLAQRDKALEVNSGLKQQQIDAINEKIAAAEAAQDRRFTEEERHNKVVEEIQKAKGGGGASGADNKKLTELQGYAATLSNQIGKVKSDLDTIPSGPVAGRLANLYAKTGKPSYSANITSVMNRLNPIVDTYVKMTAGRANRTIIESMKSNIEDAMHSGTTAQRHAAIDALTDYLQSEYQATAAAHGADIDTLPTFEDLAAGKFVRGASLGQSPSNQTAPNYPKQQKPDPEVLKEYFRQQGRLVE